MITPRMHGIHHSIVKKETDSNFSFIFNWWDRLHNTLKLNVEQRNITIGVPAYRNPDEQTVVRLPGMPFKKQRPWQLPDGTTPHREEQGRSPQQLLP